MAAILNDKGSGLAVGWLLHPIGSKEFEIFGRFGVSDLINSRIISGMGRCPCMYFPGATPRSYYVMVSAG